VAEAAFSDKAARQFVIMEKVDRRAGPFRERRPFQSGAAIAPMAQQFAR